jgi:predicted nucleotidyltransferase
MKKIIEGLIGSYAHGLNTEKSDIDFYRVNLAETRTLFSIGTQKNTIKQDITNSIDLTTIELREFCQQCLKGNPNAIEILFTPYKVIIREGYILVDIRDLFISQQIKNSYRGMISGYISMYDRLGKDKHRKGAIYYYLTLKDLWETGEIQQVYRPNLPDIDIHTLPKLIDALGNTMLPEHPDYDRIQQVVDLIRIENI